MAQIYLGFMYASGDGVPQDDAEAAKWYRLGSEQGNATAQINLGAMYAKGRGVPQDYAEAVKWYRLAARQGDTMAQGYLGLSYAQGEGVPQDNVTAHMWLNLAAANDPTGMANTRDAIGKQLSPVDLSEAQRRARVCLASSYQDCD